MQGAHPHRVATRLPGSETCSGSFWKTPRAQKARLGPARAWPPGLGSGTPESPAAWSTRRETDSPNLSGEAETQTRQESKTSLHKPEGLRAVLVGRRAPEPRAGPRAPPAAGHGRLSL